MVTDLLFSKQYADDATRQQRKAICKTCPNFKWGRCKKCGCVIDLKTRLKREQCPDEKWMRVSS